MDINDVYAAYNSTHLATHPYTHLAKTHLATSATCRVSSEGYLVDSRTRENKAI